MQTLQVNNSRIPWTKNTKFLEYYFYLNTNIYGDFQFCISIPLKAHSKEDFCMEYTLLLFLYRTQFHQSE